MTNLEFELWLRNHAVIGIDDMLTQTRVYYYEPNTWTKPIEILTVTEETFYEPNIQRDIVEFLKQKLEKINE